MIWLSSVRRSVASVLCGVATLCSQIRSQRGKYDLSGSVDTLLPMSNARRLAAALPGGTLRVVSAMGHYLPAVVADAVLEDLAP